LYLPRAKSREALAHLDKLGIDTADRRAAKESSPDRRGTDMDDPAGYVNQLITESMEYTKTDD
jgi:hypothetical protein